MENRNGMEQKVKEAFLQGYDCSQVVLRHFAEKLEITEDEANRMAACFGGGMMTGDTCGAVTGALMAIGLRYGHSSPENLKEQKAEMAEKSGQFREAFLKKHGSLICRPLLGYDLTRTEEAQKAVESGRMMELCPGLVCDAIEILEEIL